MKLPSNHEQKDQTFYEHEIEGGRKRLAYYFTAHPDSVIKCLL